MYFLDEVSFLQKQSHSITCTLNGMRQSGDII